MLAPAASVPDDGATARAPTRPCDGVMDQFTGPFQAVRVRVAELPVRGIIVTVLADRVSVPFTGRGVAVTVTLTVAVAVTALADGAREPRPNADLGADGRGPGSEPPADQATVGGPPLVGEGDAFAEGEAFADPVGRAEPGTPRPAPAPVPETVSAAGTGRSAQGNRGAYGNVTAQLRKVTSPPGVHAACRRHAHQLSRCPGSSASRVMTASGTAPSNPGTSEFGMRTARMPTPFAPYTSS